MKEIFRMDMAIAGWYRQ